MSMVGLEQSDPEIMGKGLVNRPIAWGFPQPSAQVPTAKMSQEMQAYDPSAGKSYDPHPRIMLFGRRTEEGVPQMAGKGTTGLLFNDAATV